MPEQTAVVTKPNPNVFRSWWEKEPFMSFRSGIRAHFDRCLSQDLRTAELQAHGPCFTDGTVPLMSVYRLSNEKFPEELSVEELVACAKTNQARLIENDPRKTTEAHREGRRAFYTHLDSLFLEFVPTFISQHPELAIQFRNISNGEVDPDLDHRWREVGKNWTFQSVVIGEFLDAVWDFVC